MKYRKINEDVAMGDIIIQDENIAQQIIQVKKQINDKLKRVAQIQSEIAIYNQNIAALQNKAIQSQKATQVTANPNPQPAQPEAQAGGSNESIMPSLSDFINEEDRFVPSFEDPTGKVWMDGKPRYMKYKKKLEKDPGEFSKKDFRRAERTESKLRDLYNKLEETLDRLDQAKENLGDYDQNLDSLAGELDPEVMEILSSGISKMEKIRLFNENGLTARELEELEEEMVSNNESREYSEELIKRLSIKIKRIQEKIDKFEHKQDNIGVSWEDDYMELKNESILETEEMELDIHDEDIEDIEDIDDDDDTFFVEIPPQDIEGGDVIAKVFRKEEDGEWYIRDTVGDAYFLDDLVFQKDWDKVEIIGYLADIFGDVIEINRDEYDDIIDDKEEIDDKFFD